MKPLARQSRGPTSKQGRRVGAAQGAAPSPGDEPPERKPTLQKSKEVAHTRPRWDAPSQEGATKHLSPPQTAFDRRMGNASPHRKGLQLQAAKSQGR